MPNRHHMDSFYAANWCLIGANLAPSKQYNKN